MVNGPQNIIQFNIKDLFSKPHTNYVPFPATKVEDYEEGYFTSIDREVWPLAIFKGTHGIVEVSNYQFERCLSVFKSLDIPFTAYDHKQQKWLPYPSDE